MKQTTLTLLLLIVIYFAFISLGLPDGALGIAWPFMRADFSKPLEAAGILTIILTICSAISSVSGGRITEKVGSGLVTLVSCLLTAGGLIGYSIAPSFLFLIPPVLMLGFGQGAIDAGLNYYVAAHYSSRHMNWLHSCWGIGATVGPMTMTALLVSGFSWRFGYRVLGSIQLILAIMLFLSLRLWGLVKTAPDLTDGKSEPQPAHDSAGSDIKTTPAERKAELTAMTAQIAFFALYVACEFMIGLWGYSLLVESRGLSPAQAGIWITAYYGCITIGRFLTGVIVSRVGNGRMIVGGLLTAAGGVLILILSGLFPALPNALEGLALILIGLGFAPVYPCTSHETPRRFRPAMVSRVMGYQIGAACLGGSLLPALGGLLARFSSLEIIPLIVAGLIASAIVLNSLVVSYSVGQKS